MWLWSLDSGPSAQVLPHSLLAPCRLVSLRPRLQPFLLRSSPACRRLPPPAAVLVGPRRGASAVASVRPRVAGRTGARARRGALPTRRASVGARRSRRVPFQVPAHVRGGHPVPLRTGPGFLFTRDRRGALKTVSRTWLSTLEEDLTGGSVASGAGVAGVMLARAAGLCDGCGVTQGVWRGLEGGWVAVPCAWGGAWGGAGGGAGVWGRGPCGPEGRGAVQQWFAGRPGGGCAGRPGSGSAGRPGGGCAGRRAGGRRGRSRGRRAGARPCRAGARTYGCESTLRSVLIFCMSEGARTTQ
ncbi:hypothetical protein C9F11_21530 [Streptomyces sp. YIM 121038]|nr:hypothetical protein C9F11_21530 [Streptomyces sp. YIM 121038]